MTMSNKLKFTKAFRHHRAAVLPRLVEKPVERLVDIPELEMAADTGRYLDADYGAEDREVKLNLRFCDK